MAGIDYTLGMKTAGFDTGVKGALGKLASIGSAAAKITAGVGLAAGVGAGALIAKSIGKAADMETLRTAFIPLLGGIKQARDRMAELTQFAAATPFELPEIAEASKTLETLTRGALSTGKGLTLVGDLASATNQPFSDIAVTVGRLYDGLQSGRPVGEVLMRLQELGAISGETRGKLENLQKSGASGAQAWATAEAALSRFSGSMKLQSGTWNGLMSTFGDAISATMVKFGEPIMDALKPYLEGATAKIEAFQAAAVKAGNVIADAFSLIRAAFDSGSLTQLVSTSLKLGFMEAVNTLAKGIMAAVAGTGAAFKALGIAEIFESMMASASFKMLATLKSGMADFADTVGRSGKARQFRNEASVLDAASRGMALNSKNLMFGMNGGEASNAFGAEYKKTFTGMADLPQLADARKQFAEILRPLQAAAAADSVFREVFAEQTAAAVVNPASKANPSLAFSPKDSVGKSTPTSADRLAQIGGYVGNAAGALAQKASEETAKWTRKTSEGVQKLLSRPLSTAGATF